MLRWLRPVLGILIFCSTAFAQLSSQPRTLLLNANPTGSCASGAFAINQTANTTFVCSLGLWVAAHGSGAGSGIVSLNGLISTDQFLTTCTNGLDFNIQDSVDTHSFCIPDASATARGFVTTVAQVFGGSKNFLDGVVVSLLTLGDGTVISGSTGSVPGTDVVTSSVAADPTVGNCANWAAGGQIGDAGAPCGTTSLKWNALTDPDGDLTLDMGSYSTTMNGDGFYFNIEQSGVNPPFAVLYTNNDDSHVSGVIGTVIGISANAGKLTTGGSLVSAVGLEAAAYGNSYVQNVIAVNIPENYAPGSYKSWGIKLDGQEGSNAKSTVGLGILSDQMWNHWAIDLPGSARSRFASLVVKSTPPGIGTLTFTGAGLDDLYPGGASFTGLDDESLCVVIDANGTPDTFSWGTVPSACISGATGVAITGLSQLLTSGITVAFDATIGHTIGNRWDITATSPTPLTLQDSSGNITTKVRETGDVFGRRFSCSTGTALVAGDFVPSGGWGASGSVAVTSASCDQSFHITVTAAGAGQGLNPTVAFTFKDGTWTTVPIYVCSMETGGTGALSFFTPDNTSATVLTLTYAGTPVVNLTYKIACNGWGH